MSAGFPSVFEYELPGGDATRDGLFLERLDTFMEKCLGDIKAFSERESRPYEETRRCIAQWHAKYLFQSHVSPSSAALSKDAPGRSTQVRAVLCDTSRILECLSATSGVQSFILAVDPSEASDGGFLGGSLIGREFWRGLRGGGEHGARGFKAHCTAHLQNNAANRGAVPAPTLERQVSTPPPKEAPAKSLKTEVYESVRSALRLTSGFRSAEMKWTNPERLDLYGVRLVGWPEGVPAQNPSTLKVNQNRLLLEAIQSGAMRFERTQTHPSGSGAGSNVSQVKGDYPDEDFSWAYDAEAQSASPPQEQSATTTTTSVHYSKTVVDPLPAASNDEFDSENCAWNLDPTTVIEVDPVLSSYNVDYPWEEFDEHMMDTNLEAGSNGEPASELERPRKRPRSEETFYRIEDS